MSFYDMCLTIAFLFLFLQISDGRQDTDVRNRKKDGEDDDNQQFTVSSCSNLSLYFFPSARL